MNRRSAFVAAARSLNGLFFLTTAAYCVLCYTPFAYEQFIRSENLAWPSRFVALYHYWFWLNLLVTALTLAPFVRDGPGRAAASLYLAGCSAIGVWLVANPVMATVDHSARSLTVALLALVFPVALAAVDHRITTPGRFVHVSERSLCRTCVVSACLVWATYAMTTAYRFISTPELRVPLSSLAIGVAGSLLVHLVVFCGLFVLIAFALRAVRALTNSTTAEYWTLLGVVTLGLSLLVRGLVFSAIAFTGPVATAVAVAFGATLAFSWSAVARHIPSTDRGNDSIDALLSPVRVHSAAVALAVGAMLVPLAIYLTTILTAIDWDFVLQKLSVLMIWALAFACVRTLLRRRPVRLTAHAAIPLCVLAVYWTSALAGPRLLHAAGIPYAEFTVDRYASLDPSFRLIRDASRTNSGRAAAFYGFLRRNSTIAHVEVQPIDVDFVRPLLPPRGARPHIFLFVIDSLRRDYLSPYNRKVTFTPSIERFAAESFAFDRAFTRYAATGLSLPAIWTGGMTLHMQYIAPYAPMNTLEKLLEAAGYQHVMSMDPITVRLLPAPAALTLLDRGVRMKDYRFCNTLSELQRTLLARDGDGPIFAYTVPQDVHMSNAFTQSLAGAPSYEGFYPPVALQVERIDACFGHFVDFLKTQHLYDDSIVILTSDHGDSLGENGRWGHAYTVFPEVIQVPLIIHLPAALGHRSANLAEVAFSSDIAPTLYSLLGYEPADLGPLYGTPLFGNGSPTRRRSRDPFLIASSYGPVYGMLRHNGRSLYIADAVSGRDYAYDLADGGLGAPVEITSDLRALNRSLIREQISNIAAQYHFGTPEDRAPAARH